MLCKYCDRIFHCSTWSGTHHPNAASLAAAASSGCYICQPMLHDGYQHYNSLDGSWDYRIYVNQGYTQVILDHQRDDPQSQESTPSCYTLIAIPSATIPFNPGPRLRDPATRMRDASTTVENWMKRCQNEHACARIFQPEYYPSQVLEILRGDNVRLITSVETGLKRPYAVLSFDSSATEEGEWFSIVEALRTTGVGIPGLPVAIGEVMSLLLSLGINYIWIEQLCRQPADQLDHINDEHEKLRLYSNAALTIAVPTPEGPARSVWSHSPATSHVHLLPFQVTNVSGVMSEGFMSSNLVDDDSSPSSNLTIIPWTYLSQTLHHQHNSSVKVQARLATPRLLTIFPSAAEVFWECTYLTPASETLPGGILPYLPSSLLTGADRFPHRDTAIPADADWNALLHFWYRIVNEHTATLAIAGEMINSEKRLAGLEWLAGEVGKRMKAICVSAMDDEEDIAKRQEAAVYLAGHFWGSMPLSLGWRVGSAGVSESACGKKDGRMPSWSWASVQGRSVFSPQELGARDDQRCLAEKVEYHRDSPEGETIRLSLKAFVLGAQLVGGGGHRVRVTGLDGERYWVEVEWDEEDEKEPSALRLAVLGEDEWLRQWSGLVLRGVPGDTKSFRRVGYFTLNTVQGVEDCSEKWKTDIRRAAGDHKEVVTLA
ncbi:hypothetical protein ASPACDRAFT_64727 [Aspergillus aculeatus ATCC 16872]|uniref:Heterokaryon incompatibility domain-containing protein n=1 Tax=Aspergillus aculeatus (strain ATCC 16872 / CBS 172.66 / WB 5094) TaxID=690307 RepID=A0A1L9WG22_ASPA1|nr:uncharacterized protein ASPACDRAFT_64727 [Aspergillus aculeatus ATCC 16872]OJJ95128.1 hypothetical protein ASPACDRAFT_64727 [Aspergillus aculeatus ATCC 16872]